MSPGALHGYRILELGSGVSAAYATKLCADLGADVIKVESSAGDETRHAGPFPGNLPGRETSGLFLYLNTNKRGVCLDPSRTSLLEGLLERADALIENLTPEEAIELGIDRTGLDARFPRLVSCSITPFGEAGPHSTYRSRDLNLWNAGGVAYLNGAGPGSDELPPLAPFGPQASFQAGLNAAIATLGALFARETNGAGQHVEVSVQECLVTILELTYPFWPYCGLVASRLGMKPIQPLDFFECRDGWVFLCAVEEHQWRTFVSVMGNPEWADLEIFQNRLQRAENWDALKLLIGEWMAEQSVSELYALLQSRRVPMAPVSTMGDLLASEHLRARGFFATIATPTGREVHIPGAPYRLSSTPWELRRPAPTLGQHDDEVWTGAAW